MFAVAGKLLKDKIIYFISAFFMPSILLFDLYNRNRIANHLIFGHILILAGILAILGILIFAILWLASGSPQGALLLSLLFWLCFWFYRMLLNLANRLAFSELVFQLTLLAGFVIIAVLFRRFRPPFEKIKPVFIAIALSLSALFAFNLVTGITHAALLQQGGARVAELDEIERPYYIKRSFHVDNSLPSPDIYWILLDGMMSLETVEHFWDIDLNFFREALIQQGFMIYENALIDAGFTTASFPALFSPGFYDSFWRQELYQTQGLLRVDRMPIVNHALSQVGLTYEGDLEPSFELFNAFLAIDYNMQLDALESWRLEDEDWLFGLWQRSLFGDLPELLEITTPLTMDSFFINRPLIEIDDAPLPDSISPKFSFIIRWDTHIRNIWQFDPELTESNNTDIHAYPLAYEHVVNFILSFIDSKLEENPNAVIILQGDHGFHSPETHDFLLDLGYTLEDVLELSHSVISAVRIPPAYGGLDAPIAPLNISRELVNRFVGENYVLLP